MHHFLHFLAWVLGPFRHTQPLEALQHWAVQLQAELSVSCHRDSHVADSCSVSKHKNILHKASTYYLKGNRLSHWRPQTNIHSSSIMLNHVSTVTLPPIKSLFATVQIFSCLSAPLHPQSIKLSIFSRPNFSHDNFYFQQLCLSI